MEKSKTKYLLILSLITGIAIFLASSPGRILKIGWWSIEIVESLLDIGGHTSLALDGNDYPHISYYDFDSRDLKYARWFGSAWDIQTVDSSGEVGRYTSLALDSFGYPRISY